MLLIECPWCGPRAESEFSCGGEADIMRPLAPETLTDREWGDYLFMRKNPRGVHHEQWLHTNGCRRWFKAQRDTVTYEFQGYETFDRPLASMTPPALPDASSPTPTPTLKIVPNGAATRASHVPGVPSVPSVSNEGNAS